MLYYYYYYYYYSSCMEDIIAHGTHYFRYCVIQIFILGTWLD